MIRQAETPGVVRAVPGTAAWRRLAREDRRLRRGVLLLALAATMPIAQADGSWWVLAIGVACALSSELARTVRETAMLPRLVVQGLAVLCIVFLGLETLTFAEPTPVILALAHFLVFLACCKFFELKTNRDLGLVMTIALLLLVVGGLISGSVVYAFVLIIGLTGGVAWLIWFHQRRELDAMLARRESVALPIADVVVCIPDAGESTWRAALLIGGALALTALAVFVATPRGVGRSLFGRLRTPLSASVTGFQESATLSAAATAESAATVMRVRVTRAGTPVGAEDEPLYLRGTTARRYDEGKWVLARGMNAWFTDVGSFDEPQTLSAALHRLHADELLTLECWKEKGSSPYLFTPYPPLSIAVNQHGKVEQDCDDLTLRLRPYGGEVVHYRAVVPIKLTPQINSLLETEHRDRTKSETRPRRIRNREVDRVFESRSDNVNRPSEIPAEVRSLARSLAETAGNPADPAQHARIATRLRDYFRDGGFTYTLRPPPAARGRSATETFLLETHSGHCELFASSMALLCQAVGLDARFVQGYFASEFNPVGAFYVVREKDAHAWVEVKLPGGWTLYDPTPPSRRADAGTTDLWTLAVRVAEFMQFKWATFVVSYDAELRQEMFGRFEGWFRRIDESSGGWRYVGSVVLAFLYGPPEITTPQRLLYWFMLLLTILLLVFGLRVIGIVWLMLRERFPRFGPRRHAPRRPSDARFYDGLLLLLARRGHVKAAELTPLEFARQVAGVDPSLEDVVTLTDWFYEAQYGGGALSPERRRGIRQFMTYLREGPPIGYRAAGRGPSNRT